MVQTRRATRASNSGHACVLRVRNMFCYTYVPFARARPELGTVQLVGIFMRVATFEPTQQQRQCLAHSARTRTACAKHNKLYARVCEGFMRTNGLELVYNQRVHAEAMERTRKHACVCCRDNILIIWASIWRHARTVDVRVRARFLEF